MLRDLRQYSPNEDYRFDLCIVGAGAAGIALALEFEGSRYKVALLESGGLEFDSNTQDLYRGKSVGLPYADLDTSRLRYFGGTTNHWAGYCSPLTRETFEPVDWIPHSGWPINLEDVAPYYERARDMLGMEEHGWTPAGGWNSDAVAAKFTGSKINFDDKTTRHRAYVVNAVRMGEVFRDRLDASSNVTVFLNANLTNIETNDTAKTATGLDVRTLDGQQFRFVAGRIVLAAGGIENVRLLLNSDRVQSEGLGNGHGLVGRFFSDHLAVDLGTIVPQDRGADFELYWRQKYGRRSEALIYQELTAETQREEKLTSAMMQLVPVTAPAPGARVLRGAKSAVDKGAALGEIGQHVGRVIANAGDISEFAAQYLWYGRRPLDRIDVTLHVDAAPEHDSRVLLAEETDALGLRQVKLDWRISDIDRHTILWATDWISAAVAEAGLGRMRVDVDADNVDASVHWHYHNIGTTRMSETAETGVVDRNCRVHGIDNLYIGGSSVFSTCGNGSPTFSIVALAIRLADHLKETEKV